MQLLKVKTKWRYKTLLFLPNIPTIKSHKEAVYICELSEKEYNKLRKETKE